MNFNEIADQINAAYAAGKRVTVSGRQVRSYSQPATVWGTGSLSVDVRAKSNGRPTAIWFTNVSLVGVPVVTIG